MKKYALLLAMGFFFLAVCPVLAQDSLVLLPDTVAAADTAVFAADTVSPEVAEKADTLVVKPGPVLVTAQEKEKLNLFGYIIVAIVLIGTVLSPKLAENGQKWSSTLLGVIAALKVLVDSALANGGLGEIRLEAVGTAVILACLGALAPGLLDQFPWLRGLVNGLFKKRPS